MRKGVTDILVVDDNPLLVNVISEIFKECGCIVRTASDGFAALATIRDRVPDILISDLNMPRMSGFELLSIVRRRFPAIAVIAMSGAYSGVAVPQGVAADAFMPKAQVAWLNFSRYCLPSRMRQRAIPHASRHQSGYPVCRSTVAVLQLLRLHAQSVLGRSLIASMTRSCCAPNVVAPTAII